MKIIYDNEMYRRVVVSEDRIYGGLEIELFKADGSLTITNEEFGIYHELDKTTIEILRDYLLTEPV